tara:strand:- start:539 stop:2161 length:1623 start_codon:yes stop_codon:yes gene_type:complete
MPVNYNDSLDDQLAFDACLTFVGGQVSNVRANLLDPTQYSEGLNVDIDRFGAVATRRGSERELGGLLDEKWEDVSTNWESYTNNWTGNPTVKVDGVSYYDTPSLEQLVAVSNQKVYKNANAIWSEVSGYTPASGANVEMAQLVDKLYLTDGTNNVRSYDGSAFTDEGTGTGNPPICKYIITHTNRVFAAGIGTVPDALYASDLIDGSTWDNVNFQIRVGGSVGDPITGLASWMGQTLVVFKQRSCFAVTTDPQASTASTWTVENIDTKIGCVSHRSIAQVGQDVFFLAPDGIRTVKSILEGAGRAVSEPISIGIQDVIDTINWNAAIDKAAGFFWRNHYILSVPTGSSTTNNKCIIYNTVTKSFVGTWDWDATQFTATAFNGEVRLAFSTESGKAMFFQDHVKEASEVAATYQDDGVDYESHILTRGLSFGQQFNEVLPNHTELELRPALAERVNIRISLDEGEESVVNQNPINTATGSVTLPFDLPVTFPATVPLRSSYNLINKGPCREMQFKVRTDAGKMHVRGIRASAYVNTLDQET